MKKSIIHTLTLISCIWLATVGCIPVSGKDFVLVLDAGHGGHDPGAIGNFSREKNINLNIALKVGRIIEQSCNDVKVIYTRKTDVFIPLDKRAEIANNANADLFISIHTNAAPGKAARGTETFSLGLSRSSANLEVAKRENSVILMEDDYKQRYAGFNPNSSESYIMFEFIQDKHMEQSVNLATLIQKQYRTHVGRPDRGVHQDIFLVLKATAMPSVLTEVGFISNPDEEQYLNTEEGTNALARAIFKAFEQYKIKHDVRHSKTKVPYRPDDEDDSKADIKTTPVSSTEKKDSATTNSRKEVRESATEKEQATAKEKDDIVKNSLNARINRKENKEEKIDKSSNQSGLIFKIQILTSGNKLKENDKRFKELSPIECYNEEGTFKYTYAASENYNEVLKIKKQIAGLFKDSFIIAFKDGVKINVNEAIKEFKSNRK
ncbi:N-acetylmuramoyl-L-alanine amidase family protein [Bacteroides sedimenti]|uniref:N-acetylmuramoyl-L-alanine amidase n=1 Tax=Bacteroides sedimenti TaxID=2136147 RepID=A0ABM8ICP9_9BACE